MEKETKFYKISEKELLEFIANSNRLLALEQGGVDNWSWYGMSFDEFVKQAKEDNPELYKDVEYIEDLTEIDLQFYKAIE